MKSLADFKRQLKVGQQFTVVNFLYPHVSGPRTVHKVQTTSMASSFTKPDGSQGVSWVDYPKAKDVKFDGNKVIFFKPGTDEPAFIYEFSEVPA